MDVKAPAVTQHVAGKQRKLIIVVAILLGLGILLSVASLLFGKPSVGLPLNQLSAHQREILRVNEIAQSLSPNLGLSKVQANVAALTVNDIAIIEPERARANGDKRVPKEVLDAVIDPDAEGILHSAAQRNNLNKSYKELMGTLLEEEQAMIDEIRTLTKRDKTHKALDVIESHIVSLREQVDSLPLQ